MEHAEAPLSLDGKFGFGGQTLFHARFALKPDGWTCLLGASGSGKSTLLRLLAGLETGGHFEGAISTQPRLVSYMAQSDLLAPWLDAIGNVTLGDRLRGQKPERNRAAALLSRVGLGADTHKRPSQMSGGMRQRVALARTLYEDRPVILMDEPFSALDALTKREMQALAFEVLAGRCVLMVTHDPQEAVRLGNHALIMAQGTLREIDLPDSAPLREPLEAPNAATVGRLLSALGQAA